MCEDYTTLQSAEAFGAPISVHWFYVCDVLFNCVS